MEIQKDEISGLFYFENLPENFRVATAKDFDNLKQAIINMKPFLMLGDHWPVYQCYRVNEYFKLEKIKYWLDLGRVFVMK